MPGALQEISVENLAAALERIGVKIDWRPVLKGVSLILQSAAKKCFDDETDPDGKAWTPLSARTIAGRRLGPADKRAVRTGARGPGLTKAEVRTLEKRVRQRTAEYRGRGMTEGQAKGLARAHVEASFRKEGTIASKFGILSGRDVRILRDTGVLAASVSSMGPGHVEETTMSETEATLMFGTNVAYAGYHQEGTRTIPQRSFLGVSPQTQADINDLVGEHVIGQLSGSFLAA